MNLMVLFCFCGMFVPKHSIYRYGTVSRRDFKKRYKLTGLVEDHHIIPKQWKNHKIIHKTGYNISESYNIMFMPSRIGFGTLKTNRLLHSGGHCAYNKYIKQCLNEIETKQELWQFVGKVRKNLRNGNPDQIPWR